MYVNQLIHMLSLAELSISQLNDEYLVLCNVDILHTVGPFNGSSKLLESCYNTCYELIKEHSLRSVVSNTINAYTTTLLIT